MEGPNKKRGAERQGRKEEDIDDQVAEDAGGTWQEADSSALATRRIVKGNRRAAGAPVQPAAVNVNWNFSANPAPASTPASAPAPTPTPVPAQATPDKSAKVESDTTKPATPKQTPESSDKPSTPVKEATPKKESTPAKAESPASEGQATPNKTDHAPTKEDTPVKADSSTKTEGTPQKSSEASTSSAATTPDEAPKANPFAFPSGFSFTNLPAVPFGNLPTTTPFGGLPTTTTPFGGFPTTNPFAAASNNMFGFGQPASGSIFGPAATKQDKEDEGEDGPEDDGSAAVLDNLPPPTKILDKVQTKNGEEDDTKIFEVKAKLHELENGQYKERGSGQLHLNKSAEGKYRLLMRDVNKAIRLNISTEGIQCAMAGDTVIRFVAFVDSGKTSTYLVRVGKKDEAAELIQKIQETASKK